VPVQAASSVQAVPAQAAAASRPDAGEERQLKRFPYDNGPDAAQHLIHKMPPDEFKRMLDMCNEHWEKQAANAG
jgi:ParB family chromosome partitioning protein